MDSDDNISFTTLLVPSATAAGLHSDRTQLGRGVLVTSR
jgi:hypothetical protein